MNVRRRKVERNITITNGGIIIFIAFISFLFYNPFSVWSQPIIQFGQGQIQITTNPIFFPKIRVGLKSDSAFQILDHGTADLHLFSINYASQLHPPFSASALLGSSTINPPPNPSSSQVSVHFAPSQRGLFQDSIFVNSDGGSIYVRLYGRGINYEIHDTSFNFGKIRVGTSSVASTIVVANLGDDSTTIFSVSLDPSRDARDFTLVQNTLPPPQGWFLDTLYIPDTVKVKKNAKSFKAYFSPIYDSANNIIDTGLRKAIVNITIADGNIIHDTLTGIGAEPWITVSAPVLDFGTITNPLVSSPAFITLYDTLYNHGSMSGVIDSLHNDSTAYFTIHSAATPFSLGENTMLPITVDFQIKQTGDFNDTIFVSNNSRNKPLVILKGKVRAGIAPITQVFLDTISNCLPVDTTIIIHNPYRVNVKVNSASFAGDTGGFELYDIDTSHRPLLRFPVFIGADSIFTFHIRYRFPIDSLNGFQMVQFVLERPTGSNDLSVNYDTALISLVRKTILLKLSSVSPPYNPSAGDAPFRLPVHLNGDRFGKLELDNDTLKLVFSNKLIQPVGIDRTGSLTESTATNGIPLQPDPVWNEATSTYTIPCVGLHLSSDVSKNTLLFTLLCTAYLTKDTAIAITPVIEYVNPPCAYKVSKDTTMVISYANECGDQTIRDLLLLGNIPVRIVSLSPDPVSAHEQNVLCRYTAAKDVLLSWKLFDSYGMYVGEMSDFAVQSGEGSFAIPMKQTPSSGAHYLEVIVRDALSGANWIISSKFTIIK
jgi:hypothetical protein